MSKYIKCPRCDLNYILESQKMCDVCKAELKLAPDIYSEEDEDMILCPICKVNHIFPDEEMCSTCREEASELERDISEDDDNWRAYLDDDKEVMEEDSAMASLNQLQEDEAEEFFDDEEKSEFEKGVDREYDDFDDFEDLDDEDDEDEDDEEEDEE